MESEAYSIIPTQSNIDWVGRKVTGSHTGTIAVKSGSLHFFDGQFSGGDIVIDVTSLKILDITDPNTNYQFASHLHSADFFNSEEYPEAFLEITNIRSEKQDCYHVDADLTIRGITNTVAFDAVVTRTAGKVNLITKIIIDRTLYGMKFQSGSFFKDLGDNLIYNDFDLSVNLTATKENK